MPRRVGFARLALTFALALATAVWASADAARDDRLDQDPSQRLAQGPLERVEAACHSFEPYFVTSRMELTESGAYPAGRPAILAFNGVDVPIVLAEQRQVGTVYGLAYDPARGLLYAAAYHKRSAGQGPGGAGAVYRVDLATGAVRMLVDLGGSDRHDWQRNRDRDAADWVGRSGLGDIELDASGDLLYVANLTLNRIDRVSLPTGQLLSPLRHGAADRDWARNARLMGLGIHDGWLYHGIVDSLEFSSTPGTLAGYVFRSRPDGSQMEELARFDLDYERRLAWARWDSSVIVGTLDAGFQQNAQPILSDIDFGRDGTMILGLRDRWVDMHAGLGRANRPDPGVGDLLPLRQAGDLWAVITSPEHYADGAAPGFDEADFGGLAPFPGFDLVVSALRAPSSASAVGAIWHWNQSGAVMRAEDLAPIAAASALDGANGLGDLEPLCRPFEPPDPAVVPTATAVSLTATARAGQTQTAIALTPSPQPQGTPERFDEQIREACQTDNPWAATVCNAPAGLDQFGFDAPMVIGFRDTPADNPLYGLLNASQVGSVWGLAYAGGEGQLYASAFHKRMAYYGPEGTGAIYRSRIVNGQVDTFALVPNTGRDPHGAIQTGDDGARDWAAKMSLGDIDVDPDETELFAMNLFDRRIYRYDLATGALLDSFGHGAAAESWARDARPFALKRRADGRLYHSVTHSAESGQRREDLAAYIYSSLPDGSDMRLELSFPLTYPRGTVSIPGVIQVGADVSLPLDWLPWDSGYLDLSAGRAQMTVYPQPLVSDIEFMADGSMLVAVHDRHADMTLAYQIQGGGTIRKPGIGLGDLVRVPFADGAWDGGAADPNHFGQPAGSAADRHLLGGLGHAESSDQLLANRIQLTRPNVPQTTLLIPAEGVAWYDADGNPLRLERTCFERLFPRNPVLSPWLGAVNAPQHSEWLPGAGMGDLEVLCGPTPTPTPTAPASPSPSASPSPRTSQTPTGTARPSRTPSPSATPPLEPIYLPLIVSDAPCDPSRQPIDVVLVIDASTTMRFPTRAGRPKIEAAIEAARRLLDRMRLPGDQAAIVVFNADAQVLSGLTGDRATLDAALGSIRNREFTRIHLGLDAARELLAGAGRVADHVPAVIMLTDGRSNPEPVERALEAADRLKGDGVRLFTVGLGEDVEQDALRRMASRPEDFRYAPDGEDLGPIYEQIAVEIPCPSERNWPYRP